MVLRQPGMLDRQVRGVCSQAEQVSASLGTWPDAQESDASPASPLTLVQGTVNHYCQTSYVQVT